VASALYRRYIISTAGYGAVAVVAFILAVVVLAQGRWVVALILLAAVGVAVDNFFCGDRCRVAGGKAAGEYTVPPFLKNND
jgi:hypothetical protein